MNTRPNKHRGFSITELLVAMGVIVILMALVTPAFGPLLQASNMSKAASMITDEFNLARQIALTQNRDVELRFYELPSKSGGTQFRAFRSFYADGKDASKSLPLSKVKYLPEGIVISPDPKFSTLLDYNDANRSGLTRGDETFANGAGSSSYIGFLFRATGGTNLAPLNVIWYLTVYPENAKKNAATGIPDNYFAAQLDPVTGRVRTFRP